MKKKFVYNIMRDKLLFIFSRDISALIPCKIRKLLWQRAKSQDGIEVKDEDVLCRTTAILEIFIKDTIGNLKILTFN